MQKQQRLRGFGTLSSGLVILLYIASLIVFARFCEHLRQYPDSLQIPLRHWERHHYIRVRIQGKEGWMVVDTGASSTVFYKQVRQFIRYTEHQSVGRADFAFLDRSIPARKITVEEVAIGNWRLPRLSATILGEALPLPTHLDGSPVFGILGYDLLRHWRVVRFTRGTLVLSKYPTSIPSSAITFRMIEVGKTPAIYEHTPGTRAPIWLIDTGSGSHFVSTEITEHLAIQLPSYWQKEKSTPLVGTVKLCGMQGKVLNLPVVIVPAGNPPFQKPYTIRRHGILGNGLLHRYEMVLDNKARRVWFVPTRVTSRRGTYGLLLSNRRGDDAVYVHFALPQTTETPKSAALLRAVDGVPVKGLTDWVRKRLLCSHPGTRLHLEVELPSGARQEVVCEAFAPEEVRIEEYWVETRKGSLQFQHTVLHLSNHYNSWTVYPFDIYTYRGRGVPTAQVVRDGEGRKVPLSSSNFDPVLPVPSDQRRRRSGQERTSNREIGQSALDAESHRQDRANQRSRQPIDIQMSFRCLNCYVCSTCSCASQ